MKSLFRKIAVSLFVVTALITQYSAAFAHEVYVLTPETIARDVAADSPNPFSVIPEHALEFALWGFISVLVVVLVLIFSLTKKVEKKVDPWLFSIKKYAPLVARFTLGLCLTFSARHVALFGPELPFSTFVGDGSRLLSAVLYTIGICFMVGLFVRASSLVGILIYALGILHFGVYMTTYTNYLGELLICLMLGPGIFSIDQMVFRKKSLLDLFFEKYEKYAFLILRVLFGVSVMFASVYAKFIHSALALDTVIQYHLTNYFHFTPLFIVLGAFIVESIVGFFFIIGFEIRFTVIVFWIFLALSLAYFGESVWPHMVLVGVNLALFMHGYDKYTIENKLFIKKSKLEPVL